MRVAVRSNTPPRSCELVAQSTQGPWAFNSCGNDELFACALAKNFERVVSLTQKHLKKRGRKRILFPSWLLASTWCRIMKYLYNSFQKVDIADVLPIGLSYGPKMRSRCREGTIVWLHIAPFCPHLLQAVQHGFTLPFALSFHRAATHGISEITSRTLGQAAHAGAQLDIQ